MGDKKKDGKWILNVLWEDDTNTWEPLAALAIKDPVTVVKYTKEKDLLDIPG